MRILQLIVFGILFIAPGCDNNSDLSDCINCVVIDKELFDHGPADGLSILSVNLSSGCLTIQFLASGCDGKSWSVLLVDEGVVAESNPPQRSIRLSLDNPETCRMGIIKIISFNLETLRIADAMEIILNLEGWEEKIEYHY